MSAIRSRSALRTLHRVGVTAAVATLLAGAAPAAGQAARGGPSPRGGNAGGSPSVSASRSDGGDRERWPVLPYPVFGHPPILDDSPIVEEGPIDGDVGPRRHRPPRIHRPTPVVARAPAPPKPRVAREPRPGIADGPGVVPHEMLVVLRPGAPADAAATLARRHRLALVAATPFTLVPTTVDRFRIGGARSVSAVVRELGADPLVLSAQPNHVFALAEDAARPYAAAQYAIQALHLDAAHRVATGQDIIVAVIDSVVDATHPALAGTLGDSLDLVGAGAPAATDTHGTAIAGLIAAHAVLDSAAPAARILAVRAFGPEPAGPPSGAEGTTIHVLRGLDWAAAHGARIVNMSFAGPQDALVAAFVAAGSAKRTIYVAAAGNAGLASPPLFPAADPAVLAVTATDATNHLYAGANRGAYIGVAAPGVDIFVAKPRAAYGYATGTSMAAAEVSGVVALLLQQRPELDLAGVRAALKAAQVPLAEAAGGGGPGLIDAAAAVQLATPPAPDGNIAARP